jgi:hypothetical protein
MKQREVKLEIYCFDCGWSFNFNIPASKFEYGNLLAETDPVEFFDMVSEEIDRLRKLPWGTYYSDAMIPYRCKEVRKFIELMEKSCTE